LKLTRIYQWNSQNENNKQNSFGKNVGSEVMMGLIQLKNILNNCRSTAETVSEDPISIWCLYLHLRFSLLPPWDEAMQTRPALTVRAFLPEVIDAYVWIATDDNNSTALESVRKGLDHLTHQKVDFGAVQRPGLRKIEKALSGPRRMPPLWKEKVVHGAWES
jgi:hypothetical protein